MKGLVELQKLKLFSGSSSEGFDDERGNVRINEPLRNKTFPKIEHRRKDTERLIMNRESVSPSENHLTAQLLFIFDK